MAWLAVDKDGEESIFDTVPYRSDEEDGVWANEYNRMWIDVPCGSILKLIGKELTWEDEPVEI